MHSSSRCNITVCEWPGSMRFSRRCTYQGAKLWRVGSKASNGQTESSGTVSVRIPLEYIVKPLRDQIAKAFRER